ncbi:MAG: hypothetical protein ABIL68_08530 [bacterium]
MNKKQQIISIVGIVVIFVMGLVPPWTTFESDSTTYREMPAGYYFIFSPPQPDDEGILGVKLDTSRLAVQWITVLFVMAACIYLTQDRRDGSDEDEDWNE